MWGTDGVRVLRPTTAGSGPSPIDHNAECVGWHVCKVGNRFAALEPVAQGLRRLYGSVEADVARGLALRMDHGSQICRTTFNQLRYWGIQASPSLKSRKPTGSPSAGIARSRSAVYGRVFRNLADVRAAVADSSNATTSAGARKAGVRTPLEAREEYATCRVAQTCVQETRYT